MSHSNFPARKYVQSCNQPFVQSFRKANQQAYEVEAHVFKFISALHIAWFLSYAPTSPLTCNLPELQPLLLSVKTMMDMESAPEYA